ncbi:MAG: YceI family protein [Marinicaulis sp.]|nr:YceI family protein [Marinicaulis sp.]NNL88997.1 YceI family protein [Marinicaulis sp.]
MQMITGVRIFVLAAAFAASGCASVLADIAKPNVRAEATALRAGQYRLDSEHASLLFKVDHLGFSTYVGRFERFDASLDFDPERPQDAIIEAIIDMTSLDIANDEFAATLMGPDWFSAEAFPQAAFRSTSIQITGETSGVMTGDLSLNGANAPVSLNVEFNGGARDALRRAYVVGFSATGIIRRSHFSVDRFDGLVGDKVTLEIEAEFLRE